MECFVDPPRRGKKMYHGRKHVLYCPLKMNKSATTEYPFDILFFEVSLKTRKIKSMKYIFFCSQ